MRAILLAMTALSVTAALAPASALQADDTMASWKSATAKERSELLGRLLPKGLRDDERASVVLCLDEAADVPGHADLPIGEIVKVCKSSKNLGEPV